MPGVARRLAHDAALAAFGAAASWIALRTGFGAAGTRKPLLACIHFSILRTGAAMAAAMAARPGKGTTLLTQEAGTGSSTLDHTSAAAAALSSSLSSPASWVQSTGVAERGLGRALGGRVWPGSSLGPGEADLGTGMALSAFSLVLPTRPVFGQSLKEAACGAQSRLQETALVSHARLGDCPSGSPTGYPLEFSSGPDLVRGLALLSRTAAAQHCLHACHRSRAVSCRSAYLRFTPCTARCRGCSTSSLTCEHAVPAHEQVAAWWSEPPWPALHRG